MKLLAAITVLLLLQGGSYETRQLEATPALFAYQRALTLPPGAGGQACVGVDASMLEHTEGRMQALRLYKSGLTEAPFKFIESGEAGQPWADAKVENLGVMTTPINGSGASTITFDLLMPPRSYTEVVLDLAAHDFFATAKVWGVPAAGPQVSLGQFPLFDLQSQGLSRSTTISLQEASFPRLHMEVTLTPAPGSVGASAPRAFTSAAVQGASVPPSREAQAQYTTVADTTTLTQSGRTTLATLEVAPYVPVSKVLFVMQPGFAKNFSRDVTVTATTARTSRPHGVAPTDSLLEDETLHGEIHRIVTPGPGGAMLRSEQLSVEAMLGVNLREAAQAKVAVANGDDAPLPIARVELQMRQRELCFDAQPGEHYVLRYGLPSSSRGGGVTDGDADNVDVRAPVYDYERTFQAAAAPVVVTAGAETANPDLHPAAKPTQQKLLPAWALWAALIAAIAALGWVAVRSAKSSE